ncbi:MULTISPECIES: hypothetical protein [Halobacterium]|uniref:hypothetical protein n=1 Tax=Halobacterium TaxID=2239 RepID=UPI0012FCE4F6|nr:MULTISPECIES: hypothetical protein [Halobacterium]MCG1002289.1 hypothetical protein [Halobacterium noricense]
MSGTVFSRGAYAARAPGLARAGGAHRDAHRAVQANRTGPSSDAGAHAVSE